MATFSKALTDWIAAHWCGDPAFSAEKLKGSTSATLHLLEHNNQRAVLRQFTLREWLDVEPDLAPHEAAVLQAADAANLPAPRLIAMYDGPVPRILMSYVPGRISLQPDDHDAWLRAMAHRLATIHTARNVELAWHYRPWFKPEVLAVPSWSAHPTLWNTLINRVQQPPPAYEPCFIHRDYHPVNLLWQHGQISGVVDWVNGCWGPAGVDVAHCRLNLALLYGVDAADRFLDAYGDFRPTYQHDRYWDYANLAEFLPSPPTVYQPWVEFGVTGLSDALMLDRLETYLQSIVSPNR